jgi:putative FmdB family regulatory protein
VGSTPRYLRCTMPLYEFKCDKCGGEIELILKVEDRDSCPDCRKCGTKTRRKVSLTSFSLKGGGWASDGYSR